MHICGSLICITFSVNVTLSFLVIVMFVVTNGSHNFMCVPVTSIQVNFTNGIYVCLV